MALLRISGDGRAAVDAALFGGLSFNVDHGGEPWEASAVLAAGGDADVILLEAFAGDQSGVRSSLGRVRTLVVAGGASADGTVEYCRTLGNSLAGLILNRVTEHGRDAVFVAFAGLGLEPLAILPEDRTLAAPTVAQVVEAVEAKARFLGEGGDRLLERPLIASISTDPGQSYFAQLPSSAVIVRSDKPDLQLAALNAGVPCLIFTGGCPPLSYVMDRAEEGEVPVLQTEMGTVEVVQRIDGLFGVAPFAGGARKLERLTELLADIDLSRLVGTEDVGA